MQDHTPGGVLAVSIASPILAIIAVFLRFYTRRLQKAYLGIDDWLTIPALVLLIAMAGFLLWGVHEKSIGYPTPRPPDSTDNLAYPSRNMRIVGIAEFANYILGLIQLACVKCSIIFFYRRIFCSHNKATIFSFITIITIMIIIGWVIGFEFATIFQCGLKFSSAWYDGLEYEENCPHVDWKNGALGIVDFIIDVWVVLMPIPFIWRLHLSWGRKLAISFIFLLGLVAVGASFARMIVTIEVIESISPTVDPILIITQTLYWGILESGLGLVACCLPTLRFLFGRMAPENLISSIRSILSLESLRSGQSRAERGERLPDGDGSSQHSQSLPPKPEAVLGVGGYNNETYVMTDTGKGREPYMVPGQIHVKQSVQTENAPV
ncbi:MAG: hypothetical protein M1821_009748 [Bathelium mastoideum]|nr:MAG: hypothetical protein M1821_009748 [Bathelium mastoideum]KAI9690494.1 MAG: hypothetical protein M1822_009457 [Bathelium mastoideum]